MVELILENFCLDLLLNDFIAAIPGSVYGMSTEKFIRISIGTESEERIYEAMLLLKKKILTQQQRPNLTLRLYLRTLGFKILEQRAANKKIR